MIASSVAKQSLGFRFTINYWRYHLIGPRSYLIYDLCIIERSYKDVNKNVSNPFRYLNDHMHSFDCQLINTLNEPFILFTLVLYLR